MSEGGGSSSLLLASDWQRRRLIDYFIVMGYDQDQLAGRKGAGAGPGAGGGGSLLQRFPSVDWRDTPFIGKVPGSRLGISGMKIKPFFCFFQRV